jgi:hypothetical protein
VGEQCSKMKSLIFAARKIYIDGIVMAISNHTFIHADSAYALTQIIVLLIVLFIFASLIYSFQRK